MPVLLTYPGVYIEEIPSGVRTIKSGASYIGQENINIFVMLSGFLSFIDICQVVFE